VEQFWNRSWLIAGEAATREDPPPRLNTYYTRGVHQLQITER
jgi:hypothetical protein